MVASCPNLAQITDASFGATTIALIETSIQYRKCACAAGISEMCAK